MRIGALAAATGTTAKTIRFYEQAGLLPGPPRTTAGYRDYPDHAAARLAFIRAAQSAGLTLAEIRGRPHRIPPCHREQFGHVRAGQRVAPTVQIQGPSARMPGTVGTDSTDFGHFRLAQTVGFTGRMFVSEEQALSVSFAVAASRLAKLSGAGWLQNVSETVYQGGAEYLMRVGPAGATPGVSRLVRARFTEPVYRDGTMTMGLRWEAAGVTGGLFPVLDADIRIGAEAEGESVTVTLIGSYRPPLGMLGAGLDRLLLRTVATATIRTLLARIAAVLEGAPAEAQQVAAPWRPEPGSEPTPA